MMRLPQTRSRAILAALLIALMSGLVCSFSTTCAAQLRQVDRTPAGPLVGHTTSTSSSIWMYVPGDVEPVIRFSAVGGRPRTAEVEPIPVEDLSLRGHAWRAKLVELEPETRYEFAVELDGAVADEHRGTFRTPPKAGEPVRFRLGLTSCMKPREPQESWNLFLRDEPTLHLTIGDTIYANTADPAEQWRHHLLFRQTPLFSRVVRTMPTYAMWDDHDYGPNNSDGSLPGKERSLAGWTRLWTNPGNGTKEIPGAFYEFSWGDVDFFVLDGRYYRTNWEAADGPDKTMLGADQFEWLVERLAASKAKFKVLVSGSNLDHGKEGWKSYTHERHRLFDVVGRERIPGVVYLGGSLHRSLVWMHHESKRVGYPLVEVVSSGIANGREYGYATLDFDTTVEDPTLAVRIIVRSGKTKQSETWRLSQLRPE